MDTVHVFISTGRFRSREDLRAYIDPEYDEDGDMLPSAFIAEAGVTRFEPMCIEAIYRPAPVPLAEMLARASYADQCLAREDGTRTADAAIRVFAPNRVGTPAGCSLEYVGAFEYKP